MKSTKYLLTLSLSILACSPDGPPAGGGPAATPTTPTAPGASPAPTTPNPTTPTPPPAPSQTPPPSMGTPPAPAPTPTPTPAPGTPPVTPPAGAADGTLCGDVRLDAAKVVPAGKTLTICAGSTITAAANASLTVQGKLLVQGAAGKPVKLAGAQNSPTAWPGIVVASGGEVSATYLEIRNASTAMETMAGANFTIDHLVIESCQSMLVLASGGSIAHGTMHGLGQQQGDSPISINNASPHFSDTVVNQGAFGGVDMIVVGGAMSSPVFDRMEVADSHCAFHFNSGNGIIISNSFVHHNAYGLMVVGSQGNHIVHNNFQDNAPTNIGVCAGGASAEVKDNYFAGAPFDGTCTRLLTATGASPMTPYPTGVGPTQ